MFFSLKEYGSHYKNNEKVLDSAQTWICKNKIPVLSTHMTFSYFLSIENLFWRAKALKQSSTFFTWMAIERDVNFRRHLVQNMLDAWKHLLERWKNVLLSGVFQIFNYL